MCYSSFYTAYINRLFVIKKKQYNAAYDVSGSMRNPSKL